MPLVHADHEWTTATHYATDFTGSTGATCTAGAVEPDENGNATIEVKCKTLTGLKISSVDGKPGYYLTLKADLSGLTEVKEVTEGKLSGTLLNGAIALTDSRVYSSDKLLMNVKLDEAMLFEARNEDKNPSATYTLTLNDKTLEGNPTYTVTYKIYVDYNAAKVEKNEPSKAGDYYLVEVTKANGSKEYVYVPYKADATLKDLNLSKYGSKFSVVGDDGKVGEAQYNADSTQPIATFVGTTTGIVRVKVVSASTVEPEDKPTTEPSNPSDTKPADKDKDSTPKTGNTDLMGFVPLMTLLSLVGIVTLKKTI